MITLQHISKSYADGKIALSDVNLTIGQGEMTFLTGHCGAGKSTLLKLIALIERPTDGQVLIDHTDLARISEKDAPYVRRRIGMVFQTPYLLPDRSVFDNIALPLLISGWRSAPLKNQVHLTLEKVGLSDKQNMLPGKLSIGAQQRVGIARAIVNQPAILLADEPTGNLDPDLSKDIMQLFERLEKSGITVLIASHDLRLIAKMKRRIVTLKNGRIFHDGLDKKPGGKR